MDKDERQAAMLCEPKILARSAFAAEQCPVRSIVLGGGVRKGFRQARDWWALCLRMVCSAYGSRSLQEDGSCGVLGI